MATKKRSKARKKEAHPMMNTLQDRLLRIGEVSMLCGISPTSVYRLSRQGRFPPPVAISARTKGWWMSEVMEYLQDLSKQRGDAWTSRRA